MNPFLLTLLSTFAISTLSLSGSLFLFLKDQLLKHISLSLLALAAGALLGTSLLHLLPEVAKKGFPENGFLVMLTGFLLFYVIEQVLHLHHGGEGKEEHSPKSLGVLSLLGDASHNFIDGVILAAAFLIDAKLGLAATAAVALHEIPQEIAEFGVLLYSGFSKIKALFLNFLSATTVILGGIFGFFLRDTIESSIPFVLLFAAGSFLYVGASDFIPEFKQERNLKKSLILSLIFFLGVLLMWLFTFLE